MCVCARRTNLRGHWKFERCEKKRQFEIVCRLLLYGEEGARTSHKHTDTYPCDKWMVISRADLYLITAPWKLYWAELYPFITRVSVIHTYAVLHFMRVYHIIFSIKIYNFHFALHFILFLFIIIVSLVRWVCTVCIAASIMYRRDDCIPTPKRRRKEKRIHIYFIEYIFWVSFEYCIRAVCLFFSHFRSFSQML